MEETALTRYDMTETAMSPESMMRQVDLIQQVMKRTMKEGEHYGIIPGCQKPSLLKPGAEKLSLTFRLAPSYEIFQIDLPGGHRESRLTCTLTHIPTGQIFGQGVGTCTTMESKYRFRKAEQKCPKCGQEAIIKGKKEYGGGWLCFKKKGGCGEKFQDGDPAIENQDMGRIEHDNPADYYNTVLKMGKKRAHVDAVLTATAASDIFTQDVEDMEPEQLGVKVEPKPEQKQPITEPQKKQQPLIQDPDAPITDPQVKAIGAILSKAGIHDDLARHQKVSELLGLPDAITSMRKLTKEQASTVIDALGRGQ